MERALPYCLGPAPRERVLQDKMFMDICMVFFSKEWMLVFLHPEATALGAKGTAKLLREKLLPPLPISSFLIFFFFFMIIFRVPPQINPLTPSPVEINHSLYHNPCRSFASPIPTKAIQENKEARRQTPSLAVSNAPTPASHHSSSPHPQPKKSPAGESRTKEQHRYLLWRRLPQQAF